MTGFMHEVMRQAVARALAHVERGGIPFVGVVVERDRVLSGFGVNRVHESGDPSAHAEIVAIREALAVTGRPDLPGATLLATGEPCGMCYKYALDARITDIRVAVARDRVAEMGFDYRESYSVFGIADALRSIHMRPLDVPGAIEPFTRFLTLHR